MFQYSRCQYFLVHLISNQMAIPVYPTNILLSLQFINFLSAASRRQEKTVMKLVVDAETDKVLGASMCGPDAPEIMQVFLFVGWFDVHTYLHVSVYIHVLVI